jgi:hypothetical protein
VRNVRFANIAGRKQGEVATRVCEMEAPVAQGVPGFASMSAFTVLHHVRDDAQGNGEWRLNVSGCARGQGLECVRAQCGLPLGAGAAARASR